MSTIPLPKRLPARCVSELTCASWTGNTGHMWESAGHFHRAGGPPPWSSPLVGLQAERTVHEGTWTKTVGSHLGSRHVSLSNESWHQTQKGKKSTLIFRAVWIKGCGPAPSVTRPCPNGACPHVCAHAWASARLGTPPPTMQQAADHLWSQYCLGRHLEKWILK